MKNLIKAPVFLLLVTGFSTACIAADDTGNCRDQASADDEDVDVLHTTGRQEYHDDTGGVKPACRR